MSGGVMVSTITSLRLLWMGPSMLLFEQPVNPDPKYFPRLIVIFASPSTGGRGHVLQALKRTFGRELMFVSGSRGRVLLNATRPTRLQLLTSPG